MGSPPYLYMDEANVKIHTSIFNYWTNLSCLMIGSKAVVLKNCPSEWLHGILLEQQNYPTTVVFFGVDPQLCYVCWEHMEGAENYK